MPCREARSVPVRTRAGSRELPELSRCAWLGERVPPEGFAAETVRGVPRLWSRADQRTSGCPIHGAGVSELPHTNPRHELSVRCLVAPVGDSVGQIADVIGNQ